jgi:hypothetical protein
MSLEMRLGKRGNLLTPGPESYAQVQRGLRTCLWACMHRLVWLRLRFKRSASSSKATIQM